MPVTIRSLNNESEYRDVERLQREIWGAEDIEIVSHDILITVQKNGGVLLGAFDEGEDGPGMVGFLFGFPGLGPDGKLKHCSHIAGVAEGYRDRNVGYLLKLAQREFVLAQGIELITWTFDPLESRNARFNFHKLGAVCSTYLRNLYGEMRDELNAGLPSDRFQVDWRIASPHVETCIRGERTENSLASLLDSGARLINPASEHDLPRPCQSPLPIAGPGLLIQIPSDFQQIKKADRVLALEWRMHTRRIFEEAFAGGYSTTDLVLDRGKCFYLLQPEPATNIG